MSAETEKKVRDYILENFLFSADGAELPGDASFLDMGIIDSTGVLEIIFFVEEEFGLKMDDLDMLPENLDSVNNIVRYVESHRAPQ